MKIVSTIEARMGSSRFPGKTLEKILGKPMLELNIERVKQCSMIDEIVVATSINKNNDPIEDLTKKIGVSCYRGSEEDVLDRVLKAAKSTNADIILELWGDSPLIDPEILEYLIKFYVKNNYDCVGTTLPTFTRNYPMGLSALIFKTKILEEIDKITQKPIDRENVSNYIYEHPEKYSISPLPCPQELNFPNLRFTVDEQNDFDLVKKIFENLYPINSNFNALDIVKFLNSHPEFVDINKNVVHQHFDVWDDLQKNSKTKKLD